MADQPSFSVKAEEDYVYLKTWGRLQVEDVEAPAEAALALAREKKLDKLMDNIQNVDFSSATVHVQAKGMGVLWKLSSFQKVAIVYDDEEAGYLFASSLQVLHLDNAAKFQGFDNEEAAKAWLKAA